MKAVRKLVVLCSLGMLVSSAAFARSLEQAYLATCRKDPGVPVPISIVAPSVGAEYSGTDVVLEFVVDQGGRPAELTVKSAKDEAVADAVVEAVRKWKFKPAERDGSPVATKVMLPVKIVEPAFAGSVFAVND